MIPLGDGVTPRLKALESILTPGCCFAIDFVDQLKSSIDIVKVIGEYVRLKRSGANRKMGRPVCPFHRGKNSASLFGQSGSPVFRK